MKGTLYLILTGVFSGMIPLWVKLIGDNVSPFLLAMIRTISASLLILIVLLFARNLKTLKLNRKEFSILLGGGFIGITLGVGLYVKTITIVPVANAVILLYIYPVVTAFFSWLLLKEKITKWEITGLVFALIGIWVIYGHDISMNTNIFGNLLALITGVCYSIAIITMRYFENKEHFSFWSVSFWLLMIGGTLMITLLPFEQINFTISHNVYIYLSGIILTTFFMYIFYSKGLQTIRAHNAPIIVLLTEPTTAIALAFLFLSEPIYPHILIGAIFIILANIMVEKEVRKRKIAKRRNST